MKKLLSPSDKSHTKGNVLTSSILASVIMIACCAICFTGVTWAWWTSNASVVTSKIETAKYAAEFEVKDSSGNIVTPDENGRFDLDPSERYTVTITAKKPDSTASTGYATFKVDDSPDAPVYHTVQLAPGEPDEPGESISFEMYGYAPLIIVDSSWGTHIENTVTLNDPAPSNPVYNEDPRFVKNVVKLVPVDENSTAMIERNGIVETYNTGLVSTPTDVTEIREADPDRYNYSTDDYERYYVYGLDTSMGSDREKLDEFIKVTGDGYYTMTLSEADMCGTGAVIKVYDRMGTDEETDDRLVEEFYVIIYGDVDGDSFITGSDAAMIQSEVNRHTSWSRDDTRVEYRVKAADVDCDTFVTGSDSALIKAIVNRKQSLDQKTCAASQ